MKHDILLYTKNHVVYGTVTDFLRTNGFSSIKSISQERDLFPNISERPFSVAIIDMDGLTDSALTNVKLNSRPNTKVIVITSEATMSFTQLAVKLKLDAVIIKPFNYKTLNNKLKKILGSL